MTVDKDLQQKWLAALRSGEYSQTTGVLHDDKGFCCLGVLLDVAGCPWDDNLTQGEGASYYAAYPETSMEFMYDQYYRVGVLDVFGELAEMNDGGATFQEIAFHLETVVWK